VTHVPPHFFFRLDPCYHVAPTETVHYVGSRLAGPLACIDLRPRVLITKELRRVGLDVLCDLKCQLAVSQKLTQNTRLILTLSSSLFRWGSKTDC
jgi:hypothetical protein